MIEDEALGLKVSENPTEKKWAEIKERAEKEISNSYIEIEINQAIIKLAESHIVH